MHKIDTPTSHNGAFVDPVPEYGTSGTVVDASWLNAVQNEICNTIVGAGKTLNKNRNNQLFEAVQVLINNTCEKKVFEGLTIDSSVGTTAQTIGSPIEILYAEAGWFVSASVFVKIKTPTSGADLTVSLYFKDSSNVEHLLFSNQFDASSSGNATIPIDISVPYSNGSIYFKVVASASVGTEIIIQGYTALI
jgi:hypothetical protein